MVLDYLLENHYEHTFIILYFLNLVLVIIAYHLGFAKKISLVKNIIIHILLALGTVILALFNGIAKLSITESLVIIVLVLAIYRTRLHFERKARNKESMNQTKDLS